MFEADDKIIEDGVYYRDEWDVMQEGDAGADEDVPEGRVVNRLEGLRRVRCSLLLGM